MAQKDTAALKWKKKKWFPLLAPQTFDYQEVGQSLAIDKEELVGKSVKMNVMHLTKNPRKQNTSITFKIISIREGNAQLTAQKFEIIPSAIKRFVRTGRDRIDDSFILKTKDGRYARVKPLLITRAHQPGTLHTKLRIQATSFLRAHAAKFTLDELVKQVVDGSVLKSLKEVLNKIVVLRNCEIRAIEAIDRVEGLKLSKARKQTIEDAAKVEVVQADEPVQADEVPTKKEE
ncbi:MAG: small subunit ribosomal protein S3Ae [Candidatus Woesearchaeota archaeon]|jgi:small subunit ribosomal protein S3Ae